MARNVLLLTATITPLAGIPAVARVDPALRSRDYREALSYYLGLIGRSFDLIIFAENSGSGIDSIAAAAAKSGNGQNVEFISFYGLDFDPSHGKGFGEFRLVDYAMANSKRLLPDDVIWKITGRYVVENIDSIVARRPSSADIYCHMRNYPYRQCELFLISWNSRGYEAVIRGMYHSLRNDLVPGTHTTEEVTARTLIEAAENKIKVVSRFNVTPVVRGIRAWDNSAYSAKWSPKLMVRRTAQKIAPWLWI